LAPLQLVSGVGICAPGIAYGAMRQCRSVALPVAVLLFGAVETSAQFLKGLANINPQKIASTLSDKIPQDIASEVANSKKHVEQATRTIIAAKKAALPVVEAGKEKVAAAIKDAGLSNLTEAVTDSVQVQPPQSPDPLAEAPATTSPPEPEVAAAEDSEPVASSPQKKSVVNALQQVSNALEHAGETLNSSRSGVVHDILNDTSSKSVADALNAATQGLPDALKPDSLKEALKKDPLEKAQTGLNAAKDAIASSGHADALKKAGEDLADAFHVPKSQPKAADWLMEAAKKAVPAKTLNDITETAPKVADAIKRGSTDGLVPHASPKTSEQGEVIPSDGGDDSSVSWLGGLMAVSLLTACLAGGWYLFNTYQKRDVRSPTLLADAEMAMWTRSGAQPHCPMQGEESLFRQF